MQERSKRRVMKMRDRMLFIVFILIGGGSFWLMAYAGQGPENRMEKRERLCSQRGMDTAFSAAEAFVLQTLDTPSKADLPGWNDPAVKVKKLADCRFRVASWVDAQNAFGAMIRIRYAAEVRYDAVTDQWRREELMME